MLKVVIYIFLFFIIWAPILTLFHEIGHAAIPLSNRHKVTIQIGSGKIVNFQVGNLTVKLSFLSPWVGFTNWQSNTDLMAVAGGPLVSLIMGIGFLFLGLKCSTDSISAFLFASAGWCLFQFVFTAIPITYPSWLGYQPNMPSDGLQILKMLRSK